MRCFVGIPLPQETRSALVAAGEAFRVADPRWRGEKWVAAENLHITLGFLGELPTEAITPISEAIGDQLAEFRAFGLTFGRLSPVPSARRASMLWAAYDDTDGACGALASAIGRAAADFGVSPERRPFRTHVTLVRARRPLPMGEATLSALTSIASLVPAFMSVPSATLFASTLTKAGPRYEALDTWSFPA